MSRPRLLLLAALLAGCPQDAREAAPQTAVVAPPVATEHEPKLPSWPEPAQPPRRASLPGGALQLSIPGSAISALLPDAAPAWLGLLDEATPVTATLGRPLGAGLHHRIEGRLNGGDVGGPLPTTSCPSLGGARCFAIGDAQAYLQVEDARAQLDVFSHGRPSDEVVVEAIRISSATEASHTSEASAEVRAEAKTLHARLRWNTSLEIPQRSDAAPSWSALCDGAAACLRTGPWPDIATLVGRSEPATTRLANMLAQAPPMAHGFANAALEGLGEVIFAGARLDHDGSFIAFLRVPTTQVNFVASLLPYAGLQPETARVGERTDVTWAPLPRGGILLALDEGEQPELGWVVFASTPDRYGWLLDAPRTQAQTPAAALRVSRLGRLDAMLPGRWRPYLRPHGDSALTLRVDAVGTGLTAAAVLHAPENP